MENAQFGMIGLGVMGRNFLLNVADNGFSCVGYDLDAEKRQALLTEGSGKAVEAAKTVADFCAKLAKPRKIMLLVPAGKIVDSVINDLLPHIETGDLIIDGGNSHFTDTELREAALLEKGVEFMGVGVSGGEEGARHGASIMPGGNKDYYELVRPVLETVAAKVNGEPCVAYMGAGSAGHFVKMVHNGIEYGLMQILAETFDFMRRVLGMNYDQMSQTFAEWNNAELNSFLVEITAEVLRKIDDKTKKPLVEMILDKAGQKGTGKWTSQAAMDFGVPIPTIDSAVSMRQISAQKEVRGVVAQRYGTLKAGASKHEIGHEQTAQTVSSQPESQEAKRQLAAAEAETAASLQHNTTAAGMGGSGATDHQTSPPINQQNQDLRQEFTENPQIFVEKLKNALLSAFIATYAQGMSLLQTASAEKNYGLNLSEIAKIWRGGCIIRSALLEEMRRAFADNPNLPNLILDEKFAEILNQNREDWRDVTEQFTRSCVPALCLSSALSYFDAFRSERLPANLIQAQRDFFGAHTYQRIDEEGIFHTPDWNK